jgi:exosortase/archaeosortase family protein
VDKVSLAVGAAAVAFVATILANAARISLGIALRRLNGTPDPEAHRTLGVVVYLVALWVLFIAADRCTRRAT